MSRKQLIICATITASVLCIVLLFVPEWMVNQYGGRLDRMQYSTLVDDYRKTLVQIIGGLALFAGLYFTWRTTRAAEDGRITDRFSKAVEQLGSSNKDGKKQLEPRLGGIYALERIARDSKRDHGPIVSLLCAYVRENSPRRYIEIDCETGQPLGPEPEPAKPESDIQAIVKSLSLLRQHNPIKSYPYDLSGAELFMADLSEGYFDGTDFSSAFLERSDFSKGRLRAADFTRAKIQRGKFVKADLEAAVFYRADMSNADLYGVNLSGANLSECNLAKASLKKATMGFAGNKSTNLRDANLNGANLAGVDLTYVSGLSAKQIKSAVVDEYTVLPPAVVKEMKTLVEPMVDGTPATNT